MSSPVQHTGNVVNDPDSVWYEEVVDGRKIQKMRPRSEWKPVNPNNIVEDSFQGSPIKGRKRFGTAFDDAAKDQLAQETQEKADKAESAMSVPSLKAAISRMGPDAEEAEAEEAYLDPDEEQKLLDEIKVLGKSAKAGDTDANGTLLDMTLKEYAREDGGRKRVKGSLAYYGYRKPSKD